MQKFSFLKGLIIAGVLSTMFWIGVYHAFTSDSSTPTENETIEDTIQPKEDIEIAATKASL